MPRKSKSISKQPSSGCPPRTLCIEKMTIAFLSIFMILSMIIYRTVFKYKNQYYQHSKASNTNTTNSESLHTIPSRISAFLHVPQLHHPPTMSLGPSESVTRQDVYKDTYAPPLKPNWSIQDLHRYKMPINVSTSYTSRQPYRQVGILTRTDESDNERERETILALFGRPLHTSRAKWQYYTMTDKNKGIKLPIEHKGKSGNNSYGCDEIYADDIIKVKGFNTTFRATIYDTEMLEYI